MAKLFRWRINCVTNFRNWTFARVVATESSKISPNRDVVSANFRTAFYRVLYKCRVEWAHQLQLNRTLYFTELVPFPLAIAATASSCCCLFFVPPSDDNLSLSFRILAAGAIKFRATHEEKRDSRPAEIIVTLAWKHLIIPGNCAFNPRLFF